MRKCERLRIKRIRHQESISRARRHVLARMAEQKWSPDTMTTEKVAELIKTLSNKDLRTIANMSGILTSPLDAELTRMATDEVAARTLRLEKE